MKLLMIIFLFMLSAVVKATDKPNILFIVSEDNGPELGSYGDPYAQTPTLDKLAANGVRFNKAFVPYSVCSPSRAVFYTGLYPQQNGHLGLATHNFTLQKQFPWAGSMLKKAGYRTGIIGKLHVNPESDFEVDFRAIKSANFPKKGRNMVKYAKQAARFINAGEAPFFLTINYPDAHFPLHRQAYGLPVKPLDGKDVKMLSWVGVDNSRLREYMANYYNSLSRLDSGVEMLLEELKKSGKYDNTMIIYIGDHGAQFSRGKTSVYEAGLRIPMVISYPDNMKAGTVSNKLVSSVDILPTMLQAAGLDIPSYLPGQKLQGLMNGSEQGGHKYIAGFTSGSAPSIRTFSISLRDERYKLIWNPDLGHKNYSAAAYQEHMNAHFIAGTTKAELTNAPDFVKKGYATWLNPPEFELYDLQNDPDEWRNLAGDNANSALLSRMKQALKQWQVQHYDPFSSIENVKKFMDEQRKLSKSGNNRKAGFQWEYLDYLIDPAPGVKM